MKVYLKISHSECYVVEQQKILENLQTNRSLTLRALRKLIIACRLFFHSYLLTLNQLLNNLLLVPSNALSQQLILVLGTG